MESKSLISDRNSWPAGINTTTVWASLGQVFQRGASIWWKMAEWVCAQFQLRIKAIYGVSTDFFFFQVDTAKSHFGAEFVCFITPF